MAELEWLLNVDSDIRCFGSILQEWEQEKQFFIVLLVSNIRIDRHAIIQVKRKWQNGVVDDAHMFSITVENDVQILDEKVVELDTVLTIEALLEDLVVAIDIVENRVGVFLLTSCENHDFVPLRQPFEHILNVGSQAHWDFYVLEGEFESGLKAIGNVTFELSSNQRLVHVKDQKLVLSFGAQLERFQHDFILVVVLVFVLQKLVAIAKQIDELKINQFAWVLFASHHVLCTLLVGLLETIIWLVTIFNYECI